MTTWKLEACTVTDASGLALNNMSAFWEDPHWNLLWSPSNITLEYLISQATKRQPRNLLRDREKIRHVKAIDPVSGEVVGYARWVLPTGHLQNGDGNPMWEEAQVADVDVEEKARFEELAAEAWWEPRDDMDGVDEENVKVKERILAERSYIQLEYLAVNPKNKGKGIATALVEHGVAFARSVGLPVFVLANSKGGRAVYASVGFREVDRVAFDDSKFGGNGAYVAWFMVIEP